MRRHTVAVILAVSVGVALVAGLVLLLTGTVDIGGDAATLAVELLAIIALVAGGLVAYISYEAARREDEPPAQQPDHDDWPELPPSQGRD